MSAVILSDLSARTRTRLLATKGIGFYTGDFVVRVKSKLPAIAEGLGLLYGNCPLATDNDFADFHVELDRPSGLRNYVRPQVRFLLDGRAPFLPLPLSQAMPMFEWGLNWCITHHANSFLMVHAAVVEKNGNAAMLPAPPGSGKSTLCAALVLHGWRLLSDEISLIDVIDGTVAPVPRPISLKNQSIDIIRAFSSEATLSRSVNDTMKGTVALMRPPTDSVKNATVRSTLRWIVFPQFTVGIDSKLTPITKPRAFMRVADNAFNYSALGATGFKVLADTIDAASAYDFAYSRLDDAIACFDRLEAAL